MNEMKTEKNNTRAPGIKDVAREANVSISTVSHVLNGTKAVSEPLRKRVMEAVNELNYQVDPIGRSLKSGRSHSVAVLFPSITSVFFPPLLKSLQKSADQAGYSLTVHSTSGKLEKEKAQVQALTAQRIDGIFVSSCANSHDKKAQDYIQTLKGLHNNGHRIPVICLESALDSALDSVVVNDEQGSEQAVEHLIQLGRKNIAYIAAPQSYAMGRARTRGYVSALKKADIAFRKQYIAEGDYTPLSGYQCMQELLSRDISIDAVAAGNDQMAIGAMRALQEAGRKIPEDVAIFGYNDNFPASLVRPAL
ncbi:MAG: LacI family DNA-binding transcriptional regulator, partial [Firmicutes bacterium]|nr:LacI family DNA-binding transcriptional regulator [Bacillota bacterium]